MTETGVLLWKNYIPILEKYASILGERLDTCKELVQADEWFLSLDIGLDNLFEYEIILSSEDAAIVRELIEQIFPESDSKHSLLSQLDEVS